VKRHWRRTQGRCIRLGDLTVRANTLRWLSVPPNSERFITSKHVADFLKGNYKGDKLTPPYVAYERELVDTCISEWDGDFVGVEVGEIFCDCSLHFHYFPCIFDNEGCIRESEHMPVDNYNYNYRASAVRTEDPERSWNRKEADADEDDFETSNKIISGEIEEETESLREEPFRM
jgi:hypothetical protein